MQILAALALFATPAPAHPAPERADPALVRRLIEAMPGKEAFGPALIKPDPELSRKYDDLNPGRTDEVLAILSRHTDCLDRDQPALAARVIRVIADRLGDEKVRRLIAFLESPDSNRLAAHQIAESEGEPLSPEARADVERIYALYPIAEFERLEAQRIESTDPQVHAMRTACLARAIAAMRRAKLRVE